MRNIPRIYPACDVTYLHRFSEKTCVHLAPGGLLPGAIPPAVITAQTQTRCSISNIQILLRGKAADLHSF